MANYFRFGDARLRRVSFPASTVIAIGDNLYLDSNGKAQPASAFTWAAISSMNDSWANVFCNRAGDRSGPVNSGDGTSCVSTRWLWIFPVPPARPLTVPVTYEGTALLLFA